MSRLQIVAPLVHALALNGHRSNAEGLPTALWRVRYHIRGKCARMSPVGSGLLGLARKSLRESQGAPYVRLPSSDRRQVARRWVVRQGPQQVRSSGALTRRAPPQIELAIRVIQIQAGARNLHLSGLPVEVCAAGAACHMRTATILFNAAKAARADLGVRFLRVALV
eukprot:scaffold102676_cov31-Tisochrysis_lutea.AAC.2